MDEIKVEMDGPYEDEAAIAVLNQWSFFHCLHFPRNAEEQYLKSIHFENLNAEEKNQWKNNYLKFMKTITFANQVKDFFLKILQILHEFPLCLNFFQMQISFISIEIHTKCIFQQKK